MDLVDRYIEAVTRELTTLGSPKPVNTIFIGGGTPTLLPRESMMQLFEVIRRWLPLANDGEWSIEANPQDIDPTLCRLLRDQGINTASKFGSARRIWKKESSGVCVASWLWGPIHCETNSKNFPTVSLTASCP